MPIYEFFCPDCNTIFNFLSRTVSASKRPHCPRCGKKRLERQVSLFAATGHAKESEAAGDLPIDEASMEKAVKALTGEAESINENDPRQAAGLMRKFSDMTGLKLGKNVEEALGRLEGGEDPDHIEAEMGDLLDGDENPFVLPGKHGTPASSRRAPARDNTLYEM